MKKILFVGFFTLGITSMSSAISTNVVEPILPTYPYITVLCPNGHVFGYYDLPEYTQADHQDIYNSGCDL